MPNQTKSLAGQDLELKNKPVLKVLRKSASKNFYLIMIEHLVGEITSKQSVTLTGIRF
jgi:hypothetical protein